MKYLAFILFLLLSFHFVYSQELIENKQFMIGIINVDEQEQVDHTVEAIGTYWELNITTQIWSISSDPLGESSTILTLGESDFNDLGNWDGWNFIWWATQPPNKTWATGFYKVTNDFNDSYFYMDGRDNQYGQNLPPYTNPDFFVHLDVDHGLYYYKNSSNDDPWIEISEFEIVRIWDIHEFNPPSTNSLPGYWSNVLLLIEGGDDHPRFAWGPHPSFNATNYKVYRALSTTYTHPKFLTFYLIAITDSTTYEYTDREILIGDPGSTGSHYAYYYIKAYNSSNNTYSSATKIVNMNGAYILYKISGEKTNEVVAIKFRLDQNYPNPFNPATIIQFSIKNKSFASLKIYDILGNKVAVLIENFLEAGDHSIEFDASDLPSGIYMYRLQTDEISLTKKMILLK